MCSRDCDCDPVAEDPECQHPDKQYAGDLYDGPGGQKSYVYYSCPDCKAHWKEEDTEAPEEPEPVHKWKRCDQCRHPEHPSACTVCRCAAVTSLEEIGETCRSAGGCPEHPKPEAHDFVSPAHCGACMASWTDGAKPLEDEPPLTPEEEEELAPEPSCCGNPDCACKGSCDCDEVPPGEPATVHEDVDALFEHLKQLPPPEGPEYTPCVCGHIVPEHAPDGAECWANNCECPVYRTKPDFELPPQPVRRPPYAVAYSVQGHLYEVALSGDATVRAVDGALVIQHSLGPVAGIVQVLPVVNEET
jgi:hypothetical protein